MLEFNGDGNLTILNTSISYEPLMLYIYACSDLVCSQRGLNVVNLTIYPFYSYNPNVAPLFEGIVGYDLPTQPVYIGKNWYGRHYQLPNCSDFEQNECHVEFELGFERVFLDFDNSTWQFNYRDTEIKRDWRGIYKVRVILKDDNWLGPKWQTYQLIFNVTDEPVPTIVPRPADMSSMGAEVVDVGLSGQISLDFNSPMFINPKYFESRRRLEQCENVRNESTWIVCEEAPEVPEVPENPVYNASVIDDRILNVFVEPSRWQDPSRVNLTWQVASLSQDKMTL